MTVDIQRSATFSPCRTWRYGLYRIWDQSLGMCMFIGLNPSTADETEDDPTIRRCIRFAKDWGYGGLHMTNMYAFRATDPKDLHKAAKPFGRARAVGPDNDEWIFRLGLQADVIIAAWGADPGPVKLRPQRVSSLLEGHKLHILGLTKAGQPRHPLYMKATCVPMRWEPSW